jgi:hypothetical protein
MKENAIVNDQYKDGMENVCVDSIFLNLGFAVLLAAVWNGQKIIKVGAM